MFFRASQCVDCSCEATLAKWQSGSLYRLLRFFIAAVLFVAALLKAHQLATTPSLGDGLLHNRWLNILVVEFEILFATWLVAGILPRLAWFVSTCCFTTFAIVSLTKGIAGETSCGCFGAQEVNPWLTFILDAAIVGFLILCRPPFWSLAYASCSYSWYSRFVIAAGLLIACVLFVSMISVTSHGLASLGTEFIGADGRKTILLEPEKWVSNEFPLLPFIEPIEVREQLKTGNWTVVLYHHDCPKCERVIVQLASEGTPNVVCVEVPPYGAWYKLPEHFVSAKLTDHLAWFVETPKKVNVKM
ncbi:MAG: MauE/DoxX family redox-associated membrane protein [Thermoguttaceae bacterium]